MSKSKIVKTLALSLATLGLITLLYLALSDAAISSGLENLSYAAVFSGIAVFFLNEKNKH